jgi:myo-inositol-1(or 4)-monophosphatase
MPDVDALEGQLIAFLHELADIAGEAALPYFRAELEVEDKSGGTRFDPVTAADRAVETALRTAILGRFPDHAIQGEEFAERVSSSPYRWVIDPIDGTKAFVCGLPTWGTLIGVCRDGVPIVGMMSQPFVGERFIGGSSRAVWSRRGEERVLQARATRELAAAYLFATAPDMFQRDTEWPAFSRLSGRVRITRYGVDSYAYCMLAAGYADLVVEAGLGFYDVAALLPVVEAAGGVMTDWRGEPVRQGGRIIAAANADLHAQALAVLNDEHDPAL